MTSQGIVHIEPGEFITGRFEASRSLGFKSKMWDRKLESLIKCQIVTKQVTKHFTKVSIINWNIYQSNNDMDDQLNDPQMTNLRPTHDQPVTTNKNDKNEKNERSKDIAIPDFVSSLKENPAYKHINIDNELSKMDAWLTLSKNKGRKKTPRFVLNWLNKIERPLETQALPPKREPEAPAMIISNGVARKLSDVLGKKMGI